MRSFPCCERYLLLAATAVTLLILLPGCSDDDPVRPPAGPDISGIIRVASSGQTAAASTAYLAQIRQGFSSSYTAVVDSAFADKAGRYLFDGLGAGTYRVYAGVWGRQLDGFSLVSGFSGPIDLTAKGAGQVADLSLIEVAEKGTVTGKVTLGDPAPAPVDSAEVRLFHFEGKDVVMVSDGYTDADGAFSLTDVRTGNYVVSAVKFFLPTSAPFPVYMSGDSEAFFCNGEDPVSIPTLVLTETPVEKPAIYLYPEQTGEISVTLDFAAGSRLTASEPAYGEGWRVTVDPAGRIEDRYDYLFYEAAVRGAPLLTEGWCFARGDLAAGLAQVVGQAGLDDAESADFLEYWLGRLPDFDHYLVLPVSGDDLDIWVDLQLEPAPASELRFWLFFQGSRDYVVLEPPSVAPFERRGFTVVEWGGAVLPPSSPSPAKASGIEN